MNVWHVYISLLVVSLVANLLLASAILVLDPRNKLNRLYAILALCISHWALMKLGIAFSMTEDAASLFYRLSSLGWCFMPPLFLHFALRFTNSHRRGWSLWAPRAAYGVSAFLVISLWIDDWMLLGMTMEPWGYADMPGPLYRLVFQPFLLACFLFGLFELARFARRSRVMEEKARAALVFLGLLVPLTVGAITDMILPSFDIYVFELAVPLTTLNAAIIAFAMHRYRFLNITVEFVASTIIDTMGDFLIVLDSNGKIRLVNPATSQLLGHREDELVGLQIDDVFKNRSFESDLMTVLDAKGTEATEEEIFTKAGAPIAVSISTSPLRDNRGSVIGYVIVGKDVRRQKELIAQIERARRELQELAVRDPLTDLYNRRHLMVRMKEELLRSSRYEHPFSVIMIDLDRFKEVNDEHGHEEGDRVLELIAKSLRSQVRSTDTAARYGGDEFVVVFPETTMEQAIARAARIKDSIAGEALPEKYSFVTASLGITTFDPAGPPMDEVELLRQADRALLVAKRTGKNRYIHIATVD
ncbi:MAG: diguanylate cyclase [Deltaproteobacteria bacterium]|nr:diguanylate cyclase [Deltaproteobacteria bacterium]